MAAEASTCSPVTALFARLQVVNAIGWPATVAEPLATRTPWFPLSWKLAQVALKAAVSMAAPDIGADVETPLNDTSMGAARSR